MDNELNKYRVFGFIEEVGDVTRDFNTKSVADAIILADFDLVFYAIEVFD